MARPTVILQPTYYHDHFREMIAFLEDVYAGLLGQDLCDFLATYSQLSFTAQCVFVRMHNRKRLIFTFSDLDYREIGDVRDGMSELLRRGFVRGVEERDLEDCLNVFAKSDLVQLARDLDLPSLRVSWSKSKLAAAVLNEVNFEAFASVRDTHEMFVPLHKETLGFLSYLYFGRVNDNLGAFALRDMGIVPVTDKDRYSARFTSIEEAYTGYAYVTALRRLGEGTVPDLQVLPEPTSTFTQNLRARLIFAIGQKHERAKETELALTLYSQGTSFECRERLVRLLYAQGDLDAVKVRLDEMMKSPDHDEEFIFASDFFARKFGQAKTGIYTALLRECEEFFVDDVFRGHAEMAAIGHYERQGWQAFHCENTLWSAAFGLLFWEWLFESHAAMASAFDTVPLALKSGSFSQYQLTGIATTLEAVRSGLGRSVIAATIERHQGKPNGLFDWSEELLNVVNRLFDAANPDALAGLMKYLAQDFYARRDGYPDLMLTRSNCLKFVEIKADGDQIRRHQLARLNLLKHLGFEAEIARISFRCDPQQTFVVVDVETTGGKSQLDRVTEIGAVKVRGGKVVAKWQSLINPERRIPSFITELTGIDNAMVKDAPRFFEIAKEFDDFMGDAVFVAHNVNFDYGFVASEFRRVDRRFHRPKFCTCAEMRRYFPGHASYGLAALSRAFNIELRNHHRAMADARAAAELLLIINEKRYDLSS